jgi:lipopolysaccharide heptosyltransferase II
LKILILKPSSLGDVIQALPVLRLLRRHLPTSEIYWWIEGGLAPLLEADPDLTGVVRFERRRWASPLNWGELWRSVQWVRAQRFDWVIDLQCLARSAIFAWLANGQLTIGLDEPREGARGFYDIIVPRHSFHTHAVDWYLEVLRRLKVPVDNDFEWIRPQPEIAAAIDRKWPHNDSRWIVVQPGARWPNKRWPVEFFAQAIGRLAAQDGRLRFAILGSAQDQPLGSVLAGADAQRCLDLTGKTSLPEMTEWIRRSELMLTNDTGPMHIAAALRKPIVAVMGPTEPRRTGPYVRIPDSAVRSQLHRVLQSNLPCVPCLKDRCHNSIPLECLQSVSPEQMVQAAQALLQSAPAQ